MMLLCSSGLAYWLSSIIHLSFVAIAIMILLYIPLLSFIGLYAEQRKYIMQHKKAKKMNKVDSSSAAAADNNNQLPPIEQDQRLAIDGHKADVPRLTNDSK